MKLRPAGLILIFLFAAAGIWRLAWVPWQCNIFTRELTDAMEAAVRQNPSALAYVRRELPRGARCRSFTPGDVNLNIAMAAAHVLLGRSEEALRIHEQALRYDRQPQLYMARAVVYLHTNEWQKAYDDYLRACRFDPRLLSRIGNETMRNQVAAAIPEAARLKRPDRGGRRRK